MRKCGKNIVKPDRPQMNTWRMRIASWIPDATSTHSEYVILNAFPLQQLFTNAPQFFVIRTLTVLL